MTYIAPTTYSNRPNPISTETPNPIDDLSIGHIESGRLSFVLNLGYIDSRHAMIESKSLEKAIQDIKAAEPGEKIPLELNMTMRGISFISSPMTTTAKFNMDIQADYEENIKNLLHVYKELSVQFEEDQANLGANNGLLNWLKGTTPTSLSTEDLFSNIINFYAYAEGVDPQQLIKDHGLSFDEGDQVEMALGIWKYLMKTKTNHETTKDFKPVLLDTKQLQEFINSDNGSTKKKNFRSRLIYYLNKHNLLDRNNQVKPIEMPKFFEKYNLDSRERAINISDLNILTEYK